MLLALAGLLPGLSAAQQTVSLAALDPRGPWQLDGFSIEGLGVVDTFLLEPELKTRARPFWAPWRDRPVFLPNQLEGDLALVRRELEEDGHYGVTVRAEIDVLTQPRREKGITPEPGLVGVRILVEAGEAVRVCSLWIDFSGAVLPEDEEEKLLQGLPLKLGEPFTEAAYRASAEALVKHFHDAGHPRAKVERRARVLVPTRCVEVALVLSPGPSAVFGRIEIVGLDTVDPSLVHNEIFFRVGQRWDEALLDQTADRLRGLGIFGRVRLVPLDILSDGSVPVRVELAEGPTREVRVGLGYGTNEGARGTLSWSSYNFLGGARKLTLIGRVSQITRSIDAGLVQPHFPGPPDSANLRLQVGRQDESTYIDDFAQVVPRVDFDLDDGWAGNVYLGFAYDSLSGVSLSTKEALGPLAQYQDAGFTNRIGAGFGWTWQDSGGDNSRGLTVGASSEVAAPWLASEFNWMSFIVQAAAYHPVWERLTAAVRVRAGSIMPFDGTPQIPLWSRFYAGGLTTFPVRGYARRRVGPMSPSNDPLGGRSVAVGSFELSYPILGPLRLVGFLDVGDVELPAWTLGFDDVQKGTGLGLRADTPFGPVEFDLGFGLDRVPGDSLVQVTFSIGDPW